MKLRNDLAELIHVSEGTFLSFIIIIIQQKLDQVEYKSGSIQASNFKTG